MNDFHIETAIRLTSQYFSAETPWSKPTLFHAIRVGNYLWSHKYPIEMCIAWILHDTLEDTALSPETIQEFFGTEVLMLVQANTKNPHLEPHLRKQELVTRCIETWKSATIIKSCDILDNYQYYLRHNSTAEIQRCKDFATLILHQKQQHFQDAIFTSLQKIVS